MLLAGHNPRVQGALLDGIQQRYAEQAGTEIRIVQPTNLANVEEILKYDPPRMKPDHAGSMETSLALHLHPELVQMQNLELPDGHKCISKGADESTAERGKEMFDGFVGYVARMVEAAVRYLAASGAGERRPEDA